MFRSMCSYKRGPSLPPLLHVRPFMPSFLLLAKLHHHPRPSKDIVHQPLKSSSGARGGLCTCVGPQRASITSRAMLIQTLYSPGKRISSASFTPPEDEVLVGEFSVAPGGTFQESWAQQVSPTQSQRPPLSFALSLPCSR